VAEANMNSILKKLMGIIIGIVIWIAGYFILAVCFEMDGRSIVGGFSLGMGCMFIMNLIEGE
jgi:hypothetical protein